MKHDRMSIEMYDIPWKNPITEIVEEKDAYLPSDIAIEALRKYFDKSMIKLDGKDNDIFNMFSSLGFWNDAEDNEEFIDICKELYLNSKYFEEDSEEWLDEYQLDNDLGPYAEED